MIEFVIEFQDSEPKYVQLYEYIKNAIISGNMKLGSRLPSSRNLSKHLVISRNTIIASYDLLVSEGYIESKNKNGYFVSKDIDISYIVPPKIHYRSKNSNDEGGGSESYKIDFKYGEVDANHFPFKKWNYALTQFLNADNVDLLSYGNKQGELSLRVVIADYIYRARGVKCNPNQIVITSGTQMSLDHICKLIVDKYKSIAVEDPGYVGSRLIFKLNGLEIKSVHLDEKGLNIKKLDESQSKVTLVTPSHQFPMGMTMPVSKRIDLLKWANVNDGLIIENDYEGEFSHTGRPITSLQNFDQKDKVIYLYTFSGSLLPAVRMSFYVLPQSLIGKYKNTLGELEQTVPVYQQKALESFIVSGEWEKHIRRMKKVYRDKHAVLKKAIYETMNDNVEIIGDDVGLHVLLKINNGMSEKILVEKAKSVGVKVYSTSQFWINNDNRVNPIILLGFGNIRNENIIIGVNLLKSAWNIVGD